MKLKSIQIYFLLAVFISTTVVSTQAQTSAKDSLLQQANHLFDNADEKEALDTYLEVYEISADNFEALWHISLLYAREGFRMDDEEMKLQYYQNALEYAQQVLDKFPEEGYSHFVYAVANGRISDISNIQTRIEKSGIIKKHAQKAVELIPEYAPAWHLLGIWHSEVANIKDTQKFAAGMISQGIPDGASNQIAEKYILKAIEMNPGNNIRFKLDLGRHYKRSGEQKKAKLILEEVVEMEAQNPIDKWNIERAMNILNQL